LNSLT